MTFLRLPIQFTTCMRWSPLSVPLGSDDGWRTGRGGIGGLERDLASHSANRKINATTSFAILTLDLVPRLPKKLKVIEDQLRARGPTIHLSVGRAVQRQGQALSNDEEVLRRTLDPRGGLGAVSLGQFAENLHEHPAISEQPVLRLDQGVRILPSGRQGATLHPISHNRHERIDSERIQLILGQRRVRERECQRRQRRPECPA